MHAALRARQPRCVSTRAFGGRSDEHRRPVRRAQVPWGGTVVRGGRRVCHGAPATTAQGHSSLAFLDFPVQHLQGVLLTGSEGERPAGRFPALHRRRGYAEQAGELEDRESALVA